MEEQSKEYWEQRKQLYKLQSELRLKEIEIDGLIELLDGKCPSNVWWLMRKCNAQRKVIASLEKRGPGHTKEEREELALVSAG